MSSPFVAEIRIFAFDFAPTGWATCDGQLLPISQNTALFSLLGTNYGGNGASTFGLPNLQGSVPMQPGQGPGLSLRDLGEAAGSPTVTLLLSEIPQHTHVAQASANDPIPDDPKPIGKLPAKGSWDSGTNSGVIAAYQLAANNPTLTTMATQTLAPIGGSLPHENMQPYLTVNFCIALQGVFPQRS